MYVLYVRRLRRMLEVYMTAVLYPYYTPLNPLLAKISPLQ